MWPANEPSKWRSHAPLAYSISDALDELPIGRSTLKKLLKSGQIRSFTVGRRRVIPASELRRFAEGGPDAA